MNGQICLVPVLRALKMHVVPDRYHCMGLSWLQRLRVSNLKFSMKVSKKKLSEISMITYIHEKNQSFGLDQRQHNHNWKMVYVFFATYDPKIGNAIRMTIISQFLPFRILSVRFIYIRWCVSIGIHRRSLRVQ